jgi:hypothetical protein
LPFVVRVEVTYGYVPMGAAGTVLGQQQADMPGFGATATPGPVFFAQSAKDIVGETVPGGESPTSGNFNTALAAAATDLQTRLTTANQVPGFTTGTLLALVQGWSTGLP